LRALLPSDASWPALEHLLDEALDQPASARLGWLAALAPEHAPLRATLAQLLQAHARAESGDLYGAPPRLPGPWLASGLVSGVAPVPGTDTPGGPVAGGVVGLYRLLRELGQGGMGSVWLAERSDGGLKRQVALKLPRLSWVPGLAERLARERDILASLLHPHIARLYDAGLDAQGRPYLAIEYVEGLAIDAHAEQRALPVPARLALLLQVASAVAYAHSQLVVHRDLKPSNIWVAGDGQVRLLDFGIAKLVGGDSAEDHQLTQTTGRALTPDYASPEQIRGDPIGTASDVYSLGVVAYELLSGRRPYRLKPGLGPVALADALLRVERPVASQAATAPALQRQLKGDLDAILARALAPAPQDRYATVQAFADDLTRHLRGEPVHARAPSRAYLAERWVRRHKLETALAAALVLAVAGGAYAQVLVLLALGAGTLAALWQRNRAVQHAQRANAATARAEQVKDFIASIFTQAVPRAGTGGAVAAADLLRAAAQRVERDLAAQPAVAAELGALIGASFNELGETAAGLAWLPKVVTMCTRELGHSHPLTLQSRWRLAEAANTQGDLAVAESTLPALLRDLQAAVPPQPGLLVQALQSQAFVDTKRGREAEALSALSQAADVATQHFGAASPKALLACSSLSNTFIHFGRPAQALRAIEPAFVLAQAALGPQRPHLVLAAVERDMAAAMASNQRPREAAELLRRVLADQRALDGAETSRVRIALTFLGRSLLSCGSFDEARGLFEQAHALHDLLSGGANHEAVGLWRWRARVSVLMGDGALALTQLASAQALADTLGAEAEVLIHSHTVLHAEAQAAAGLHAQVLAATDRLLAAGPSPTGWSALRLLSARASALRHLGRHEEAHTCAQQALAAASSGLCTALDHGLALAEAARCHQCLGEPAQAQQCLHQALAVWRAGQVDGPGLWARVQAEVGPWVPDRH
jgi:eukaryotic-like serine/threonine-protein kinase